MNGHPSTCALSVVIPAYNERVRLPPYLEAWLDLLRRDRMAFEIVVVDDGSSDGTVEWVQEIGCNNPEVRLVRNDRNRGKGYSICHGMREARGEVRLFADADGATPAGEYQRLMQRFDATSWPVVIGTRIPLSGITTVQRNLMRHYSGRVFATMMSLMSGLNYYDTQCGFKMFSARAAEAIFPLVQCRGWAFDVEVLMLAQRMGFGVAEVPVNWSEVPGSKVRILRAAPRMLRDVVEMRWRHRHLKRIPKPQ